MQAWRVSEARKIGKKADTSKENKKTKKKEQKHSRKNAVGCNDIPPHAVNMNQFGP